MAPVLFIRAMIAERNDKIEQGVHIPEDTISRTEFCENSRSVACDVLNDYLIIYFTLHVHYFGFVGKWQKFMSAVKEEIFVL